MVVAASRVRLLASKSPSVRSATSSLVLAWSSQVLASLLVHVTWAASRQLPDGAAIPYTYVHVPLVLAHIAIA